LLCNDHFRRAAARRSLLRAERSSVHKRICRPSIPRLRIEGFRFRKQLRLRTVDVHAVKLTLETPAMLVMGMPNLVHDHKAKKRGEGQPTLLHEAGQAS
jgi:hypothetical protein